MRPEACVTNIDSGGGFIQRPTANGPLFLCYDPMSTTRCDRLSLREQHFNRARFLRMDIGFFWPNIEKKDGTKSAHYVGF